MGTTYWTIITWITGGFIWWGWWGFTQGWYGLAYITWGGCIILFCLAIRAEKSMKD
jgi:hypothetical protein